MSRTNRNSVEISAYTETGKPVGIYTSITNAAKSNNVSQSTISNALFHYKDHFAVGKFWLRKDDSIEEAMMEHKAIVNRNRERAELYKKKKNPDSKAKEESAPVERKGNYIFVKSSLSGNECCGRCALYYERKCLPCRTDEGHEHGYWRYSGNTDGRYASMPD